MILHSPIFLVPISAILIFFLLRFLRRTSLFYYLYQCWVSLEEGFHAHQSFKIPQFNDHGQDNQLFRRVSTYLNSLTSLEDSDFTNLFAKSPSEIALSLDPNQTVVDDFLSARLAWTNQVDPKTDSRSFVLKIRRRDKRRILRPYLQHIHTVSDEIEQKCRDIRLFINSGDSSRNHDARRWKSAAFTHPATFETIVLDQEIKNKVKSDLELFLKSKQYYHRLGRVWKRSYLLYGSPGSGKSSFVAAMAKILCYDVYDVDLSRVTDGLDLKMLLLQTSPKSLIVLEDLDRFLMEKSTAVSGSLGVLSFMDGIFSACGEERVIVFTMDSRDRLDPTVLMRPGRVDVHVHFPPCDFSAFKSLANSHLGLKDHKLFPQVEESFQSGSSKLSPAEIGEIMISNRSSPSRALKSVITALQTTSGKIGRVGSGQFIKEGPDDSETIVCKESVHMVREFRKLYGLLRRSGRKEEPYDLVSAEGSRHGGSGA